MREPPIQRHCTSALFIKVLPVLHQATKPWVSEMSGGELGRRAGWVEVLLNVLRPCTLLYCHFSLSLFLSFSFHPIPWPCLLCGLSKRFISRLLEMSMHQCMSVCTFNFLHFSLL